jgi:hypothetical protein
VKNINRAGTTAHDKACIAMRLYGGSKLVGDFVGDIICV